MPAQRILSATNIGLLTVFLLMTAAATVVAVHEIFFSLPECPGGATDCMMRQGHWEGSRLVGLILLATWVIGAVWLLATRAAARRGRIPLWLIPLWFLPLFVLANLLPILS